MNHYFNYMYVWMSVYGYMHVGAHAPRSQNLHIELLLEIELLSFNRTTSAVKCTTIPAQFSIF